MLTNIHACFHRMGSWKADDARLAAARRRIDDKLTTERRRGDDGAATDRRRTDSGQTTALRSHPVVAPRSSVVTASSRRRHPVATPSSPIKNMTLSVRHASRQNTRNLSHMSIENRKSMSNHPFPAHTRGFVSFWGRPGPPSGPENVLEPVFDTQKTEHFFDRALFSSAFFFKKKNKFLTKSVKTKHGMFAWFQALLPGQCCCAACFTHTHVFEEG